MSDDVKPSTAEANGWGKHAYRTGSAENLDVSDPEDHVKAQHGQIEPWLSAVFQSEHLSLLLGSGFTAAVASSAGGTSTGMGSKPWESFGECAEPLRLAAIAYAKNADRGETPNIEDQARAVLSLMEGLRILSFNDKDAAEALLRLKGAYGTMISDFLKSLLLAETEISSAASEEARLGAAVLLQSFLLSFASRSASRERLHIFTTNYDRVIEHGCDLAGLHVLDRFVGSIEPRFRSSRLDVDLHYNPPGIRGEPRYMEGVLQLTKLHGSLDWRLDGKGWVRRVGLPFGAASNHPAVARDPADTIMIYPNAAKDRETADYPYVDLFRDFAASVCQPNSSLVTYGYGFGDDHINRVLADMLPIPSTHLVIISYGDEGGRVSRFCDAVGRKAQISLLIGPHFADMTTLAQNYLPKPAIDRITMRQTELLRNRHPFAKREVPEAPAAPAETTPAASGTGSASE